MFSRIRNARNFTKLSILLILGLTGFGANAQEVTRTGDVDSLVNCANQKTKDEQLSCFLELTDRVKGQPAVITNEVTVTRIIEKPADEAPTPGMFAKMRNRFGITRTEQSKELNQISVSILSFRKAPRGQLIFTTADGQVWQQMDSKRFPVREKDLPIQVVIRKRSLGAFHMHMEKGNRTINVKRRK